MVEFQQEQSMNVGKDVLQLIFVTEKIVSALRADNILSDEAAVVRQCATELLEATPESTPDESLLLPFLT